MKNIHTPEVVSEFMQRIDTLKPDTQRQWGKMDAAQMLAHCSNAIQANLGERTTKRGFIGILFGKMAKKSFTSGAPIKQNLPTDKNFLIADAREFNAEKQRFSILLKRLSAADPEEIAKIPHPFFGKMTSSEWTKINYNHIDYHLRQFGA